MTSDSPQGAPRICVVVPTYDNSTTIAHVVDSLRPYCDSAIVVDDGSADDASQTLDHLDDVALVRHPCNLGKGAALMSGFVRAREMGFTHAVTMDADGQHAAEDLPRLMAAVRERPEALVIGVRDLRGGGARRKSRFFRFNSDFWVDILTGHRIHDSQSGFRAYPLDAVLALSLSTTRYDFEMESLVKLAWSGTPVVQLPVRVLYGPGSKSHFRPFVDFVRIARANFRLVAHKLLLPSALRRKIYQRSYGDVPLMKRFYEMAHGVILHESATPGKLGLCVGLGVMCGILPLWGIQTAVAALAAHALKLSKPLVIAASNISFPIMIPLILYLSVMVGRFLLFRAGDPPPAAHLITPETIWLSAQEYLLGSVVLAVGAGVVLGLLSYLAAKLFMAPSKR